MNGRAALRFAAGSLLVAAGASVFCWLVTMAALPYRVPIVAAVVAGLLAAALALYLGSSLLARRVGGPVGRPPQAVTLGAGLIGPTGLAAAILVASSAVWWFRLAAAVLLLGAAATGLRAGVAGRQAGHQAGAPAAPLSARGLRTGWRHRDEQGSGSLEIVGVTVLAAVLVAAVIGAVGAKDPRIRDAIWAQICSITGGECELGEAPSQAMFKPDECELYSTENRVNATVDVTFVRLGGGGVVQRVEKSNGDIEITMLHEGRGGLVASAGAKGNLTLGSSTVGAGWQAEAAATGGYQSGETYVFTDRGQADAFQDYLQGELAEDSAYSINPIAGGINWAYEKLADEGPPTNSGVQKTYTRYDGTVEGAVGGGVGYGASASVEGSAMVALGSESDRGRDAADPADDTKTDFYQVDWSVGMDVGLPAVKGISGSYSPSGVVKVTRNADGEVVRVAIVDRTSGGFQAGLSATDTATSGIDPSAPEKALAGWGVKLTGGAGSTTVVTQTLDLDEPEERDLFEDWFNWSTAVDTAGKATMPTALVDTAAGEAVVQYGDRAEEFTALLANEAKVSIVEYEGTTWGLGANVEAGLGIKGGLDIGYTDNESRAVEAAYLGAPDADGDRVAYDLPECVA